MALRGAHTQHSCYRTHMHPVWSWGNADLSGWAPYVRTGHYSLLYKLNGESETVVPWFQRTRFCKLFTWLMALEPDQVLQSGSMTGDGGCALVNKVWCSNTAEADGQWFPDVLLFYSKCTFVSHTHTQKTKIVGFVFFFIFLICLIAGLCLSVKIPISFSRQV